MVAGSLEDRANLKNSLRTISDASIFARRYEKHCMHHALRICAARVGALQQIADSTGESVKSSTPSWSDNMAAKKGRKAAKKGAKKAAKKGGRKAAKKGGAKKAAKKRR
jgi:hypothetical protein